MRLKDVLTILFQLMRAGNAPLALSLVLSFANSLHAAFAGFQFEQVGFVQTPQGTRKVLRLYAQFTEGSDTLISWGASGGFNAVFKTQSCWVAIGNPFYNPAEGGNSPPSQATIDKYPHVKWDTFATIGIAIAEQGSAPGGADANFYLLPTFIEGNALTMTEHGVFLNPEHPKQGRADYFDDPQKRVLMAQFTVRPEDAIVRITLGFFAYRDSQGAHIEYNLTKDFLEAYGRCCKPSGCVFTTNSSCYFTHGTFIGCQPCSACNNCSGDVAPLGGDGVVDVNDVRAVIESWGPCISCSPDTVAPMGVVNLPDLLHILSHWGPCD